MAHLFRSEDMIYVRLTISKEAAHDTIRSLGAFGNLHFVDLNEGDAVLTEDFKYFKKRVVACDYWERKLRALEEEMRRNDITVPAPGSYQLDEFNGGDVLNELKNNLDAVELELQRNNEFREAQTRELNDLRERQLVLENAGRAVAARVTDFELRQSGVRRDLQMPFLAGDRDRHSLRGSGIGGGGGDGGDGGDAHDDDRAPTHSTMMGTIPVGQRVGFDRMLFRTTRGNAYVTFSDPFDDCVDPQTGEKVPKCVFCVVYIGAAVQRRIIKMCEFFQARRYPVPENAQQVQAELKEIEQAIMEKQDVLERTISKVKEVLSHLASDTTYPQKSHLRNYQDWIRREKLVCETLKRCYTPDNSNLIRAEGWLPADQFDELNLAVRKAVQFSGAQPALVQRLYTRKSPPTYFKLDKLTTIFQGIVNTYGVPRYKEVNPGLFTIITFPFLFGVMYGDIGHGFVLFMAALLVVCNERKLLDMQRKRQLGELGSMIVGGRYLILLMGFFGFYCGLVYNDLFSIPLAVFGAKYSCCDSDNSTFKWSGDVYPFGVDPSWYNTKNELTFFNSLKMKLSVVLGVIHMVFGISLGAFNHLYFHDYVSLFGEFVPQMIFMLSTFGYMIFLILFKFTQTFPGSQAPNLIQTMIKMFLSPGSVSSDLKLYEGQGTVQAVLILLAVISMPWMLLSKPLYLRWRHKQSQPAGQPALLASRADDSPRSDSQAHEVVMDDELKVDAPPSIASSAPSAPSAAASAGASASAAGGGGGHGHGHGHGEFVFSEVFIHQAIHTIEFILGAVSNTASYLRLWALSLAHAELSNVFWEKLIMEYGVTGPSPIFALVGFGAWLGATTAVLLSMDVLECFLHALRLHWVEFQNKFFAADGYQFTPFTFEEKIQDD